LDFSRKLSGNLPETFQAVTGTDPQIFLSRYGRRSSAPRAQRLALGAKFLASFPQVSRKFLASFPQVSRKFLASFPQVSERRPTMRLTAYDKILMDIRDTLRELERGQLRTELEEAVEEQTMDLNELKRKFRSYHEAR